MGSLLGHLTNQGITLPSGQIQTGAQAQNTVPSMPSGADLNTPSTPSTLSQPSYQQASQSGAKPGGTNAFSPELSKGGKLMTLLSSGLQGALAGRAAQEQTIAQTGGRRAGGVGTGFEAGYQLPWQRAMQGQQLQQAQAQTALTQQQSQLVPTQWGMMPPGLAKILLPAGIKSQTAETVQGMKGQTAESVQQQKGQTAESVAGINKRFIPVEGVGLFDTNSRTVVPGTSSSVTITPEIAKDYSLPPEFQGKPMKLSDLNAFRFQNVPEMTAQGPVIINRNTATAKPVSGPEGQRYSPPAMAGPQQVADPNNPGQTTFVSKGQSFGMAGPQSASVQVPRQAMKAEVPTKIGDQKVAFTTMIQHAALLREATHALANGDMQTLNGLENRFKNEFGSAGPITASAIADAYKGEVSNVINKGHITDQGNERIAHSLDPNKQNYAQMDSVLGAYQSLAQSKMNMLGKQTKSAVAASQPTKRNAPQANDPLGLR